MSTPQEVIAKATPVCTSIPKVNPLTNGTTEAILTFNTRQACGLVLGQLENAGAKVRTGATAYGEYMLIATW